MKEITLKAPEGYEFVSDRVQVIHPNGWYCVLLSDGSVKAKQNLGVVNTADMYYPLRKVWTPKKDNVVRVLDNETQFEYFLRYASQDDIAYDLYTPNGELQTYSKKKYSIRKQDSTEQGEE